MGKIRGKLGGTVYAVAGGENIVREKATSVTNPNTDAQVETRAKFKLMSQLAAVVRPVLAIKKNGLKSAGNQFVSMNYDLASYASDAASVNLNAIQLTKGILALPAFTANRASGTKIAVSLNEDASETYDKVIYSALIKNTDGDLSLLDSKVAEAGSNNDFAAELLYTADAVVIYAYGMRENTENANTKFGSMIAPTAEKVAKLLTSNSISSSDVTLSKTQGLTMLVGEDEVSSDDVEHFVVVLSKSGNGSVSGAGRYVDGQQVTVIATPDSEASFVGWHVNNLQGQIISTAQNYTFTIQGNVTLVGEFEGGPVPTYTIAVSSNDNSMGTVSGGGTKQEGASCTIVATPAEGYRFVAWKRGNTVVSNNASYTFTVSQNETLVAYFEERPEGDFENVTYKGSAWNANKSASTNETFIITGTNNSNDMTKVGLVKSSTAPEAGNAATAAEEESATPGQAFSMTVSNLAAGKYWLVAMKYDGDSGSDDVVDVYDYYVNVSEPEGGL